MENCPYCSKPLDDDDIICWHCGRDVVDSADGAMPDLIDSIAMEKEAALVYGRRISRIALLAAILCFSGVGWFTSGIALSKARTARQYLKPGDPGYGNILIAEISGWLMAMIYWCTAFFIAIYSAVIQILTLV